MTNSLEKLLIDTVHETKQGVGKAVDWAMAQAPELCEQYLRIEMVKASTAAALSLIGIAILGWLCVKVLRWAQSHGGIYEHPELMMLVFPTAGVGILCGIAYSEAMTAATIAIAPKVYLVEFAAKLIK